MLLILHAYDSIVQHGVPVMVLGGAKKQKNLCFCAAGFVVLERAVANVWAGSMDAIMVLGWGMDALANE